jgi:hypothetical protein
VQALILRAVTAIIAALSGGGIAGAIGAGGGGGGSSIPAGAMSGGGVVYAAGGMFRPRGSDTVPAMLTPGEVVLPRGVSAALLSGRAVIAAPKIGSRETGAKSIIGGLLTAVPTPRAPLVTPQAFDLPRGVSHADIAGRRGGSGRAVNLTINAVDKRGVRELLIEHSDALSDALDYLEARAG